MAATEDEEDMAERQHFASVIRAYDHYRTWANKKVCCHVRFDDRNRSRNAGSTATSATVPPQTLATA